MNETIIGIIGGLGPASTAELYNLITSKTCIQREQDHFRIIIDSNPKIPDRTAYITGKGESPLPYLTESVRLLTETGVNIIVIPCNTAHYFSKELQIASSVPVLDMIELTLRELSQKGCTVSGLLSTQGIYHSKVYSHTATNMNIDMLEPSYEDKELLMEVIYDIKSGIEPAKHKNIVEKTAKRLLENGADCIVLGCTELSLFKAHLSSLPVYDPLDIVSTYIVNNYSSQ